MWRKGNPHALLVGMQTAADTMENSMEFPQKTKNGSAFCPGNSIEINFNTKFRTKFLILKVTYCDIFLLLKLC